jgi:hypothetical protein
VTSLRYRWPSPRSVNQRVSSFHCLLG